jgi:hypothetical protein
MCKNRQNRLHQKSRTKHVRNHRVKNSTILREIYTMFDGLFLPRKSSDLDFSVAIQHQQITLRRLRAKLALYDHNIDFYVSLKQHNNTPNFVTPQLAKFCNI